MRTYIHISEYNCDAALAQEEGGSTRARDRLVTLDAFCQTGCRAHAARSSAFQRQS